MRTVRQTLALYKKGALSPVDVVAEHLARLKHLNPELNAVCHSEPARSMREAMESARRWKAKKPKGPLDGIPVTVKDLWDVAGWPTRHGSKTTSTGVKQKNSATVQRLIDAGAIVIAKTTLPEFGHKGVTDSPLCGITRNPWNLSRTSGGSSGGAAVCAAAGIGMLHLGSDAGGSIRIPASFCGVFGFKPSPGVVPAWPPSLFATLSARGPITTCVEDAAVMMDVIAQADKADWNALPLPAPSFVAGLGRKLPKLKIAVVTAINGESAVPETLAVFNAAVKSLSALGTVTRVKLECDGITETFSTLWMATASYMTGQMTRTQRKMIDKRLATWAKRGDALHLHDYIAAEQKRMSIGTYFKNLLDEYDLLITPTTPMPAFEAGRNMPNRANGKPWEDWTPFTYPANLAKLPACTLPCGLTCDGLPVGMQVMGGYLEDVLVLQAAYRLEKAFGPLKMP